MDVASYKEVRAFFSLDLTPRRWMTLYKKGRDMRLFIALVISSMILYHYSYERRPELESSESYLVISSSRLCIVIDVYFESAALLSVFSSADTVI